MTSVAERLDIADRLRGISLANSRRVDVEADAPDRAVVTDGWIRKWDQQKGEYFWENPKMSVITHENPFLFDSPSAVPRAMANQWFKVFDEKEQKNYYVNPTLSKEQWNKPVESAETVQLVKAHYMEEYAVEHFNRKHGWLHGEESVESLLAHSDEPLKYPLLKMDSELERCALLLNKEIHEYTDGKKKREDNAECIRRMIALLLLSPAVLVDECYCQLMKHMTKCHTQYVQSAKYKCRLIIDRAWEILSILSASVLPSAEFTPYVEFFIQNSNNTVNTELPQRCYSLFTECKIVGSRVEVPSLEEIRAILVPTRRDCDE